MTKAVLKKIFIKSTRKRRPREETGNGRGTDLMQTQSGYVQVKRTFG